MFQEIAIRLADLIKAPLVYKDMLWIITPLVITMFLMEIYFGRYKFEELGWSSAFGNSLVLIFVSIDLLRFLYNNNLLTYLNLKNVIVIGMITEGFILTLLTFFHLIPKQFAFGFSDKLPINIVAYLAVILVYSNIPIDIVTGFASILIAILIILILKLINLIIPESWEE